MVNTRHITWADFCVDDCYMCDQRPDERPGALFDKDNIVLFSYTNYILKYGDKMSALTKQIQEVTEFIELKFNN